PEGPRADGEGHALAHLVRADSRLSGYVPRRPGGAFDRPILWRQAPTAAAASPDARMMDLDGDGILDLIQTSQDWISLYYRRGADGWGDRPQLVPRARFPSVRLSDPHAFPARMNRRGRRARV